MGIKTVVFALMLAALPALGAYQYECYPPADSFWEGTMKLVVQSSTKATLEGHALTLDATYKPRLNKDYRRFDGGGFLSDDGYNIDLLLHKNLFEGVTKSSLKVTARGEGFFNYYVSCYRR